MFEDTNRERDHKQKDKEIKEREEKAFEEVLATSAQLATFNEHLDAYDTATVHALMENGEALDRTRDGLRLMEDNAVTLPDGRHVFKSVDGRHVFDERGAAVPTDVIDPQRIDDQHTKWETYKAGKADETKLETERNDLLAFQAKVDAARDKAGEGKVSKRELDDLEADLKANAPHSVRQKLGMEQAGIDAGRDRPAEALSPIGETPAGPSIPKRQLQALLPQ